MSRKNEIEKRKIKLMKPKAGSLKKQNKKLQFNKTDKPQAKMIKEKGQKLAILGIKEGISLQLLQILKE